MPFLGEVPLHMTIREKSDSGLPVVATEPDGEHAKIYRDIAAKVRDQLVEGAGRIAPKIVIEASSPNNADGATEFRLALARAWTHCSAIGSGSSASSGAKPSIPVIVEGGYR